MEQRSFSTAVRMFRKSDTCANAWSVFHKYSLYQGMAFRRGGCRKKFKNRGLLAPEDI